MSSAPATTNSHKKPLNQEKLAQLKKNAEMLKAGNVMRKKKIVHKVNADDTRLLNQLKSRLGINPIPEVDEVAFFFEDNHVQVFKRPRVQAAPRAGVFVISGSSEEKDAGEYSNVTDQQAQLAQILQELQKNQKKDDSKKEDIPDVNSFEAPE